MIRKLGCDANWCSVILIALVATVMGCQPALRPEIEALAQQLRDAGRVESALVDAEGRSSEVWALSDQLARQATKEELLALLDDPSPTVRVHSMKALKEAHPGLSLFPLVMARLSDDEFVVSQSGCIVMRHQVADLLVEEIIQDMTPAQKRQMFEWLLKHPNELAIREIALSEWPHRPEDHELIRSLAEKGAPGALRALARFKDPADVPVILRHLQHDWADGLEAVEVFPHPAFIPRLREIQKAYIKELDEVYYSEMGAFYRAVAAYRSSEAKDLIRSILDVPADVACRRYAIEYAFLAVVARDDPYYDDLLMNLWADAPFPLPDSLREEDMIRSKATICRLFERDPKRVGEILRVRFAAEDFYRHRAVVAKWMVELLFTDPVGEDAWDIYNAALAKASLQHISAIAVHAVNERSPSSLPVLFSRLTEEGNPNLQCRVAGSLLHYESDEVVEEIERLLVADDIPANDWGRDRVWEMVEDYKKRPRRPGEEPTHWEYPD